MIKCFLEKKKCFHLLEGLSYKNGKAQNMPVVAGRLVTKKIQIAKLFIFF